MLQPTYTEGEQRLLQLADMVERSTTYDQVAYTHGCGTPACAMGHWATAHPEHWRFVAGIPVRISWKDVNRLIIGSAEAIQEEFGLTGSEAMELFGNRGCGDAGTDAGKAAVYLRDFVRKRHAARMIVSVI